MRCFFCTAALLFIFNCLISQTTAIQKNNANLEQQKPIAKQLSDAIKEKKEFYNCNLFIKNNHETVNQSLRQYVDSFIVLTIQKEELQKLLTARPEYLRLIIPNYKGQQTELLLKSHSLTTPDFTIKTSNGTKLSAADLNGLHYWGILNNQPNSTVAISVFQDDVMGIISAGYGNINIGKLKDKEEFLMFNDITLKQKNDFICDTHFDFNTNKSNNSTPSALQTAAVNCIKLYWEINYDIYLQKGNLTSTINFIMGIFNQHQLLYANDNISVTLSELKIWNSVSPYSGGNSSVDWLTSFQNNTDSFNGNIATFIKFSTKTGGLAGFINGLCDTIERHKKCYAGILNYYYNLPVYSWSVTVIAHEQAHIMGSMHTHDCVWNGNNTAIDGCGPAAGYPGGGSCDYGPIPDMGTIMSYCYLPPNPGVDLNLGFGHQPDSLLIANINNASCLAALPCQASDIFQISKPSSIIIYPNPSKGVFTIELADLLLTSIQIKIYNAFGQEVFNVIDVKTVSGIYSVRIELPNYQTGIYLLQIIDESNNRINKKIVIE